MINEELRVTNKQIQQFYLKANPHPQVTDAYMRKKYGQMSGAYISFAKICESNGEFLNPNDEQIRQMENYQKLSYCINNNVWDKFGLDFLKQVEDIQFINIDLKKDCEPNQKWHLYISIFAQCVMEGNGFDWNKLFKKYPCLQLKLWLAEEAGLDVSEIGQAIQEEKGKAEINRMIKKIDWVQIFQKVNETI